MPIYTYECKSCKSITEQVNRIANMNDCPDCHACGGETKRITTAPMMVSVDNLESYQCPVTEQIVTSTRQKKRIEAEHDLVVKEPGMGWRSKQNKKDRVHQLPDALKGEMKNLDKYMADNP